MQYSTVFLQAYAVHIFVSNYSQFQHVISLNNHCFDFPFFLQKRGVRERALVICLIHRADTGDINGGTVSQLVPYLNTPILRSHPPHIINYSIIQEQQLRHQTRSQHGCVFKKPQLELENQQQLPGTKTQAQLLCLLSKVTALHYYKC